jgi:hypothetical protein
MLTRNRILAATTIVGALAIAGPVAGAGAATTSWNHGPGPARIQPYRPAHAYRPQPYRPQPYRPQPYRPIHGNPGRAQLPGVSAGANGGAGIHLGPGSLGAGGGAGIHLGPGSLGAGAGVSAGL